MVLVKAVLKSGSTNSRCMFEKPPNEVTMPFPTCVESHNDLKIGYKLKEAIRMIEIDTNAQPLTLKNRFML